MDNFSLTRHVRHRTIGSWELASRSTEEGWGNALSGVRPVDTAPTQLGKTSRTKNLITEYKDTGFQGYEPEDVQTFQPQKKPKGKELSPEQREQNHLT